MHSPPGIVRMGLEKVALENVTLREAATSYKETLQPRWHWNLVGRIGELETDKEVL